MQMQPRVTYVAVCSQVKPQLSLSVANCSNTDDGGEIKANGHGRQVESSWTEQTTRSQQDRKLSEERK